MRLFVQTPILSYEEVNRARIDGCKVSVVYPVIASMRWVAEVILEMLGDGRRMRKLWVLAEKVLAQTPSRVVPVAGKVVPR